MQRAWTGGVFTLTIIRTLRPRTLRNRINARHPAALPPLSAEHPTPAPPGSERVRRAWAWADLMRRVFAIDVLACAACGGRLRLLATIEDPLTVTKILAHLLGLPTELPTLTPARSPPQQDGFDFT